MVLVDTICQAVIISCCSGLVLLLMCAKGSLWQELHALLRQVGQVSAGVQYRSLLEVEDMTCVGARLPLPAAHTVTSL
jgi:hypothetical protein